MTVAAQHFWVMLIRHDIENVLRLHSLGPFEVGWHEMQRVARTIRYLNDALVYRKSMTIDVSQGPLVDHVKFDRFDLRKSRCELKVRLEEDNAGRSMEGYGAILRYFHDLYGFGDAATHGEIKLNKIDQIRLDEIGEFLSADFSFIAADWHWTFWPKLRKAFGAGFFKPEYFFIQKTFGNL